MSSDRAPDYDTAQASCSHVMARPSYSTAVTQGQDDTDFPGLVVTFHSPQASEHQLPEFPSEDTEPAAASEELSRKLYPNRYWILVVFTMLNFMQGGLTLSWNVIAESVFAAFGWNAQTLSLMQNWLYLTYLMSIVPFAMLMERKGMRISVFVASFLLVCGTAMRCITTTVPGVTVCAHLGHALVGLSGPVIFTAGPVLSAVWFPPNKRATMTAIMSIAGFAGSAVCFIVGPLFVGPPKMDNGTIPRLISTEQNYTNLDQIRQQIQYLRFGECGVCVVIFLAVWVNFPSAPPTAPSLSASIEKLSYSSSVRDLFKRRSVNFWLVAIAYGLSTSIYAVWSGLLDVNMRHLGVTEAQAGWFGFYAVAAGCLCAVGFGKLADYITGKMKVMIVLLLLGSILSTIWILLLANNYIEYSYGCLFTAVIVQGLCNNAPIPLFFELAIESAYPVPEAVVSGMMSILFNVFPLLFLNMFLIPNIGTQWMNWAMLCALVLCFPLMIVFKARYKRLALDTHAEGLDGEETDCLIARHAAVGDIEQHAGDAGDNAGYNDGVVRQRPGTSYGSIN